MAQGHDARLAELVTELGGNEVRFLFRDLVEKALQELIDAELTGDRRRTSRANRDEDEPSQRGSSSGVVDPGR